jgi:TolB-like protein
MEPYEVEHRLTTILSADVVGYSHLMSADEAGTFAQLKTHRKELLDPKTTEHHGRVVKLTGDGTLMEFGSAMDAVLFAVEVQRTMLDRNAAVPEDRQINYRVGINLGDIIIEEGDIYGDGVNVAARLEGLAVSGGICVSGAVFEQVEGKVELEFKDLGEQQLKNIDRPIRVYRIVVAGRQAPLSARSSMMAPSLELPDKPSIAVLPFDNMSGDPEQEYFADGIAEDIITALSTLRWFFVIARNSTFTYKGRAVDVKQVARELGVRYVVEGSVRKAGNRVRISVQLIDAAAGSHLWAERYDRELTDIFEVQDEIMRSVAASIEPQLLEAEASRSQTRSGADLDAWTLVMRARARFWHMTKTDSGASIALLQDAIKRYPEYGPAHSTLASVLFFSGHMGWTSPDDFREAAAAAARRAIAIDDLDPWAHVALGHLNVIAKRTDEAVAEFDAAINLNPNFAAGYGWRGLGLAYAGRSDEAIKDLEQALRLSPRDPQNAVFVIHVGVAHYLAGRYENALEWTKRGVQMRSDFIGGQRIHCATLGQLGRIDEAKAVLAHIRELQPNISAPLLEQTVPYARPADMAHFLDGLRKAGLQG